MRSTAAASVAIERGTAKHSQFMTTCEQLQSIVVLSKPPQRLYALDDDGRRPPVTLVATLRDRYKTINPASGVMIRAGNRMVTLPSKMSTTCMGVTFLLSASGFLYASTTCRLYHLNPGAQTLIHSPMQQMWKAAVAKMRRMRRKLKLAKIAARSGRSWLSIQLSKPSCILPYNIGLFEAGVGCCWDVGVGAVGVVLLLERQTGQSPHAGRYAGHVSSASSPISRSSFSLAEAIAMVDGDGQVG